MAAQGLETNPKIITMKSAKALGNYEATVHFHREISVVIPVEVVSSEPLKKAPKAAPAPAVEATPAEETAPEAEAPAEEVAE